MNLFTTETDTLSLPVGTFFLIATVEVDLSIASGFSFDNAGLVTLTMDTDPSDISISSTCIIAEGLTTGSVVLTVQQVVTLTAAGDATLSVGVNWQGSGSASHTVAKTQFQALQLETLSSQ